MKRRTGDPRKIGVRRARNILCGLITASAFTGTLGAGTGHAEALTKAVTQERTPVVIGSPMTPLLPAPDEYDFYNAPDPLPGKPGDVIWRAPSPTPVIDVFGYSTNRTELPRYSRAGGTAMTPEVHRILYHSTDRRGRSIPAFALLIFDPQYAENAPVIVAMHGWLGFGDLCGLMRGDMRGAATSAPSLIHHYVSRGYLLVLPDGAGMGGRGTPTLLVASDTSRNLLDAAHATQLLTGTAGRVIFHGHSMGGAAVLSVPVEAETYAPGIAIAGIVSVAGGGYYGPGTPWWSEEKEYRLLTQVVYTRMLEESYGSDLNITEHLTLKGRKRIRQIENLCNTQIGGYTGLDTYDGLFKESYMNAVRNVSTTENIVSSIPVYFITPTTDSSVSSLPHQHAYLRRCARGEPSFLSTVAGDHRTIIGAAHDTEAVRTWIENAVTGKPLGSPCSPIAQTLNVGFTYSPHVLLATFTDIVHTGDLRLDAHGSCSVNKNRLLMGFSGRCAFSVTERIPRKVRGKTQWRTGRAWHFNAELL